MSLSYPTQENLNKAAFVLATIQNTYKLNLTKLADGVLNVSFKTPLNEHDCFAIGVTFAEEEKYHIAVVWLLEAFRRFNKTDGADELGANILNNLVYAYKMLNNIKEASFWLQQLLHAVPEHPQLKCKYLSENHPFLKLAPVKLEELYLGPDVYLFHNVISDREIEDINSVSKTRFKPCALFKKRKSAEYRLRLCDSTFLEDDIGSKTLIKLYRRVHDFTGMTVNYSEELHVVKYSVGGYYAPHTDFWRKTTSELGYEIQGNRLATVLFYVSVVEKVISNLIKDYVSVVEKLSSPGQGGATVFPHLGLNVYPVKGAALFWKNLYASGEGDLDTVHASCPVIRGSKMIMTQWINSIGQELSLPCSLKKEQGWRENLKLPILEKIMNTSKHVQIKRDMQNCRRYDSRKVFSRY
ncbi:prolyl 4-hydroxylase subunit alpha-2-like [Hyposmocoma kahamanoa]|uniref:prolyl 4-hydroxylase subunit alpha-2-like n=1 Tax=Hyposmocoma kahamanoa TaxID=1477025 RepID=UPI000E6D88A4|nr:prolyl 4-hydroxylase subunit alpha-2-like [Hyposmocoma kahamanoa]